MALRMAAAEPALLGDGRRRDRRGRGRSAPALGAGCARPADAWKAPASPGPVKSAGLRAPVRAFGAWPRLSTA